MATRPDSAQTQHTTSYKSSCDLLAIAASSYKRVNVYEHHDGIQPAVIGPLTRVSG